MPIPELWEALVCGKYYLANQMINRGTNINEPAKIVTEIDENLEVNLLHYAVSVTSDVHCIRVMINLGANVNARDSGNCTPLHWAAAIGACPDVIELLINEGAIVDARDDCQMTPLHRHAVRKENGIESARKLIARGASIDAIGLKGTTALHMALAADNLELVKVLISHRVNINAKDNYGYTPLLRYFIAGRPNPEITELLLDNGADVMNSKSGQTALHMACKKRLADVTAVLLKFGADLNARNKKGKIPFELLSIRPSSEATAQIIIREAVKREAFGQSLCEGYKQMVQSCENYSKFDQECREEIKRMKSEKIDIEDSAISFFYIFSMNEEKLVALARNEKIVTAFESSGYVALFRIYAGELTELQKKCEVAKKRANILKSVEDCLGEMLGDVLPASIVRKIATYVNHVIPFLKK